MKPLAAFARHHWCRTCCAAYRKAYYQRHGAQERAAHRKWLAMNHDHVAAYSAARHAELQHDAEYRRRAVQRMVEWQRQHPEAVYLRKVKRRARKAQVGGMFTIADVRRMWQTQGGHCFYCGTLLLPGSYHVDHQVPLSRGGSNGPNNLCIACPKCNVRKGRQTAQEFLMRGSR